MDRKPPLLGNSCLPLQTGLCNLRARFPMLPSFHSTLSPLRVLLWDLNHRNSMKFYHKTVSFFKVSEETHASTPQKHMTNKVAPPGHTAGRGGRGSTGFSYHPGGLLLQDLLLTVVNHGGPAPRGPHDPPAPGLLGVQDSVPRHSELSFRARASAAHLRERS